MPDSIENCQRCFDSLAGLKIPLVDHSHWKQERALSAGTIQKSMKMNKGVIEEPLQADSIVGTYQEGLRLFMGQGELNQTLVRLVRNLEEHGID